MRKLILALLCMNLFPMGSFAMDTNSFFKELDQKAEKIKDQRRNFSKILFWEEKRKAAANEAIKAAGRLFPHHFETAMQNKDLTYLTPSEKKAVRREIRKYYPKLARHHIACQVVASADVCLSVPAGLCLAYLWNNPSSRYFLPLTTCLACYGTSFVVASAMYGLHEIYRVKTDNIPDRKINFSK